MAAFVCGCEWVGVVRVGGWVAGGGGQRRIEEVCCTGYTGGGGGTQCSQQEECPLSPVVLVVSHVIVLRQLLGPLLC